MGNREPKWLTLAEVAAAAGQSYEAVRYACARGRIPHFRIGRNATWIRVTPDGLRTYLQSCTRVP